MEIEEKTENKFKKIQFLKFKVLPTISLIILSIFSFIRIPVEKYYSFSDNIFFQMAEDKGYVNVYNYTLKQNGITCVLQAIVSDQITTYVRIKIIGDLPEISQQEVFSYSSGKYLTDRIENAYLTDAEGNCLAYKDQKIYTGQDGTMMEIEAPVLSSIMDQEKLSKNEAILVFFGGLSENAVFSFEIVFKGQNSSFKFENLTAKIPPIVHRSFDHVSFATDYATGLVKEITYTIFETRFTIDWTGTKHADDYNMQNKGIYYNGNQKYYYFLPYPYVYNNDDKIYTNTFVLNIPLDPQEDLRIDRYQNQYSTFVEEFLFIPRM